MQPLFHFLIIKTNKMKKQYWYIMLVALFVTTVSFVVIKYKNKQQEENNAAYQLLPRKGNTNTTEWQAAKKNTDNLIAKIKVNPADIKSALALANAWIMEARTSGNIAYYDKAALQIVNNVLTKEPENYEALILKSLLQLSQHHFADGLATANTAVNINNNNAFVYGLLTDANIEMGNYGAALDAADKMVSIRPDLRSYSRIAYLREIHGDYTGAINAMKLAVAAGMTAEEATEWCRTQLGKLYEHTGDVKNARFQYSLSLAARPNYAYALAGLARIAAHEKKYDSAIYYYQQAEKFVSDLGVKENLALAYKNAGQTENAKTLNAAVIAEMNKNAATNIDDPNAGHYSDKELAYAYLQNNNYDKALEHALAEYNRRPKNIEVNETLAWVYYKRNEMQKALDYLDAALITHSMNPVLLCTAGLIYAKTGNTAKGKMMLTLGLKHNAVMPEDIKNESTIALQKL
jgi:tetratricopeptide (TPR) repeat protein